MAIKNGCSYVTVRRNKFTNCITALGHNNNGLWSECYYNEICYNYIDSPTGRFNASGTDKGPTWQYRNTYTDTVEISHLDYPDSCEGNWYWDNNVIQNSYSATGGIYFNAYCSEDGEGCVTLTDNLTGSSGLIDGSGNLVNRSDVGTYGWEIAESEYYEGSGNDPPVSARSTASGTANWR